MTKQTKKFSKSFCIFGIAVMLMLLVGCGSSKTEELERQNSALATQNAILLAANENAANQSSSSEVEAPPPPAEADNAEIILATKIPEALPTEPVPAGMPITYDGWSITVSKNINIDTTNPIWGIDVYVRNMGDSDRLFRFTNASVTISDNTGYEFEPSDYCPYMGCDSCEEYYHEVKNLNIRANDKEIISSGTTGNGCMKDDGLGMFVGPIPTTSQQLIVHFDDFGPFTNVDVIIDL
jgi:hypothetical protein